MSIGNAAYNLKYNGTFLSFAIALENTSLVDYKLNDNVKPP